MHGTVGNTEEEIDVFRYHYSNLKDSMSWEKGKELSSDRMDELLDQESEKLRRDEEE